jgi:riboflavin biosynthesis pyrimidine reductase
MVGVPQLEDELTGVHTVRSLGAANLVDEYWLKVNPAIVGRGGSMFSDVV